MANNLTDAGKQLAVDFLNGNSATITGPLKVALLTAQGTEAAAGTEVTGGSYARQTVTFAASTSTSGVSTATNSGALTFTSMPACTVVGFAIYDSTATPKRLWEIGRTGGSATVNAGDTFQIAAGALSVGLD